jgi:hypothetical protein
MIAYLRALASRFARRGLGRFFPPTEDPEAGVRVPRSHGPGGRGSAIAVAEPREETFVRAQGRVARGGDRTIP